MYFGTGLGAVLLKGATVEDLALHTGAAKQAATAHICRGRNPLSWLWLQLGSAQAQTGDTGDARALSVPITDLYLPQGEVQPGHSWQKGGWYPPMHWQRLQRQVPRRLHTFLRALKQLSLDCWHWQALPSYPGWHLHTPQSHCPRAAEENLSDPAGSQAMPSVYAWRASPTLRSPHHPPWDAQVWA